MVFHKIVGGISFTIEFLQVLLHVGTFQLSDLCYNTVGGVCGGILYYLVFSIRKT